MAAPNDDELLFEQAADQIARAVDVLKLIEKRMAGDPVYRDEGQKDIRRLSASFEKLVQKLAAINDGLELKELFSEYERLIDLAKDLRC